MALYIDSFELPVDIEREMLDRRAAYNGGKFGYIDNPYPCGIFDKKGLSQLSFDRITILYGGNGSGKSTLLNLISEKLRLNRVAPINTGELFDDYVKHCEYTLSYDDEGFQQRIPNGSRMIASDEIFDYMLTVRTNNDDISEAKEAGREERYRLRYKENVPMRGMEDYENLRRQLLARKTSRREYLRRTVGEELKLGSNGENALEYFEQKLKSDRLYCLDEPENSLSPRLQIKLAKDLEELARYCGCQLIIATHSPFLLAMDAARIYDLDSKPVTVRKWWELENTRLYFEFFHRHEEMFLGHGNY